jgi:hypothetical protein
MHGTSGNNKRGQTCAMNGCARVCPLQVCGCRGFLFSGPYLRFFGSSSFTLYVLTDATIFQSK